MKSKNAKYKIKSFFDETLSENIWICYGTPKDYFLKQIKKELGIELGDINIGINGKAYEIQHDNNIIYVIWTKKKNPSYLAHEAVHVVHWLLGAKGMWLDKSSEEIYCYLVERIIREAIE
ncbi:MAG: hypothetical protein GY861_13925 [bacterium]|nr:hypothetical protein [bacterium]